LVVLDLNIVRFVGNQIWLPADRLAQFGLSQLAGLDYFYVLIFLVGITMLYWWCMWGNETNM
jgi:hypothetical protein